MIKNPDIIAEKFNEFFVNIGASLVKNNRPIANKTYQMYMNKSILTPFQLNLIDGTIFDKTVSPYTPKWYIGETSKILVTGK